MSEMRCSTWVALLLTISFLYGCNSEGDHVLGTLEYDRITVPAPVAERIVFVAVKEGDQVRAGQLLLQLETTRNNALLALAQADVRRAYEALVELEVGPRRENVIQARAEVAAARAIAQDTQGYYGRLQPLQEQQLVSKADFDTAKAEARNAAAQVRVKQAVLDALDNGNRPENIAEGKAVLSAAKAKVAVEQIALDKLRIAAPRDGIVDSLPYKLGGQAPVGLPLVILLVGDVPYARIYVPAEQRAHVAVGNVLQIYAAGYDQTYIGTVRMIRGEPSFTPYYALTGKDATRLSYLAEVALEGNGRGLPAGVPVRVILPQ